MLLAKAASVQDSILKNCSGGLLALSELSLVTTGNDLPCSVLGSVLASVDEAAAPSRVEAST